MRSFVCDLTHLKDVIHEGLGKRNEWLDVCLYAVVRRIRAFEAVTEGGEIDSDPQRPAFELSQLFVDDGRGFLVDKLTCAKESDRERLLHENK